MRQNCFLNQMFCVVSWVYAPIIFDSPSSLIINSPTSSLFGSFRTVYHLCKCNDCILSFHSICAYRVHNTRTNTTTIKNSLIRGFHVSWKPKIPQRGLRCSSNSLFMAIACTSTVSCSTLMLLFHGNRQQGEPSNLQDRNNALARKCYLRKSHFRKSTMIVCMWAFASHPIR